jgi:hypothetical protein
MESVHTFCEGKTMVNLNMVSMSLLIVLSLLVMLLWYLDFKKRRDTKSNRVPIL